MDTNLTINEIKKIVNEIIKNTDEHLHKKACVNYLVEYGVALEKELDALVAQIEQHARKCAKKTLCTGPTNRGL